MSKRFQVKLFILLVSSILMGQVPPGSEIGIATLSIDELKDDLTFLASDELAGRPAGSDENLIAGIYIARAFKAAGLLPLFTDQYSKPFDKNDLPSVSLENSGKYKEYFQSFNIQRSKLTDNNDFMIQFESSNSSVVKSYEFKKDYFIDYDGLVDLSLESELVFVGFGIDNGVDGYNDFLDENGKPLDLNGKIAIVIDGYPRQDDPDSDYSKLQDNEHRIIKYKVRNAKERGAAAVFVLQSPLMNQQPLNIKYSKFLESYSREYTELHNSRSEPVPVFYLSNKICDDIFNSIDEFSFKDHLAKISSSNKQASFQIKNMTISLNIDIEYEVLPTQNIVGFLEGTDEELKNEIVVFGAHYDHVGLGYYGAMNKKNKGLVHNGADDNASGTVGLIELAEAFAANPPKRSSLFIAFNAEENGLLGSKYYVRYQPLFPLSQTVAMVNLDMISRNEPELLWIGGAFQGRDIVNSVETANELIGFELLFNVGMLSNASDQAYFLREDIPAVFFFTGLHEDYHMPTDDIEFVNFEKLNRVTKLAYLTGWILTNQKENPKYEDIPMDERKILVTESAERMKKYRNK